VPAGWFLAGGDPDAPDSLSARRVWVDGFVCRRFPVTNAEYAGFLYSRGDAEDLLPRDVPFPTSAREGAPTFGRGPTGRFTAPLGEDPERWARVPVTRIDLVSAHAYAESLGWRLPDELEREKAARGVDGRHFPWGDHHDPAFSCTVASQPLPRPVPVDEFPFDESVYGIRGLAGNVRDFCRGAWTPDGPARDGERVAIRPIEPLAEHTAARGGAWSAVARLARSATRFGDRPSSRHPTRGFRLFRSLFRA
jgi:serine/threonine-protein kinase